MRIILALTLAALSAPVLAQPATPAPATAMPLPSTEAPAQAPLAPQRAPQSNGGPSQGASVFSPTRAAPVPAPNHNASATQQMGGMPPAPNYTGQPGGFNPSQPMGQPGMPTTPAVAPDAPVEVPAVFVGKFNGLSVYRASNGTYLFDKEKRPKVVPKETGSLTDNAPQSSAAAKK